jgi:hypothetical protein
VETVVETDALEALGCDSMRIVEITVALSEQFPWLPSTLLFEHKTVSQIVKEIVRLAAGSSPSARPAVVSAATAFTPAATTEIAVVGIDLRCAGADSPAELWSS